MGFAFSKLWNGLFAAEDNFKVGVGPDWIRVYNSRHYPLFVCKSREMALTRQLVAVQIIIVGLNNAGKTTILYKLWVHLTSPSVAFVCARL